MGKSRNAWKNLVEKPEGKRTLSRPSVDGRVLFKFTYRKQDGRAWIDSCGSG
jgi:hypothetical protein